jgi:transcriptional regulator with XRE-family HTH domain
MVYQVSDSNTFMTEVSLLVATLKKRFKAAGLTYRDVGRALGLSEPSVKRLLGSGRLTVERLVQLCDLLGMSMSELMLEAESAAPGLHVLTHRQEAQLVSNGKLLLVAVCALNRWTMEDIVSYYRLTAAECIKSLLVLDRIGLLSLKPGNRIRLRVARDFDWLPGGPIQQYFAQQGLPDFIASRFDAPDESMGFVHGMLTKSAHQQLQAELAKLRARFAALHDQSTEAPLSEKHGTALLLAMRVWEPEAFRKLRRAARE